MEWKDTGRGNQILQHDDFFLSYNPDCGAGETAIYDILLFGEIQGAETAICKNRKYYILKGDHRKELEDKSFDECIAYFNANIENAGPSSDYPATK